MTHVPVENGATTPPPDDEADGGRPPPIDYDDDDSSSSSDVDGEDLDAFLIGIESRLRSSFSSPELTKAISSQWSQTLPSSGKPSSPSTYLRLVSKVFDRAAKPIKLRVLLSLLGLEPDLGKLSTASSSRNNINTAAGMGGNNGDGGDEGTGGDGTGRNGTTKKHRRKDDVNRIVWDLLRKAESDDDEWVRIVGCIVRGKMFRPSSSSPSHSNQSSSSSSPQSSCRGAEVDKLLRRTCDSIIRGVMDASVDASNRLSVAEAEILDNDDVDEDDDDDEGNDDAQKRRETLLESYLIGRDGCPTFVPFRCGLLRPSLVKKLVPETTTNPHFVTNADASVLQVDAVAERAKVEEERKELEAKGRTKAMAEASKALRKGAVGGNNINAGRGVANGSSSAGRGNAGRTTTKGRGRGAGMDTAAMFMRMKRPGANAAAGPGAGRGGRGTATGGGRGAMLRGRGLGRGAAADSMGRSLATPMQRKTGLHTRTPGGTRALLASRRPGGSAAAVKSGRRPGVGPAAPAGGRAAKSHAASKMKMIDVSEVEGLAKHHRERTDKIAAEETRESKISARKRKIIEEAAARGLRTKKKWGEGDATAKGDGEPAAKKRARTPETPVVKSYEVLPTDTSSPSMAQGASVPTAPTNGSALPSRTTAAQAVHPTGAHPDGNATPRMPPALDPLSAATGGIGLEAIAASALSVYQQQVDVVPISQQPQHVLPPQAQRGKASSPAFFEDGIATGSSAPSEHHQIPLPPPVDAAHAPPNNAAIAAEQNWRQLLDRSNKLSDEERARVELFFTERSNPTPNVKKWKMKMNEEKLVDQATGETVKETLYLELDYETFGFKKLRKIKRK